MTRKHAMIAATIVAIAGIAAPPPAQAQAPGSQQMQQQQMQRMQQQMQRLDEAMRRMTRIHEHAHQLEQTMLRQMEQLRHHEHLQPHQQEQLRHQERIRYMAHALSGAAGEMGQAMMGLREMAQNAGLNFDGEMEREMERLRQHMEETLNQMEGGLRVMERLRDRLTPS